MRHAFDADHIAAIDNTTRKIMQTGKHPLSVGFWFSFGHSTVVFALALLLAFGVKNVAAPVLDGKSQLHQVTSLIGTIVSRGFLYVIAIFNLMVLFDIIKVFRQMRRGQWLRALLTRITCVAS
jgi:high-affinity nickel-transport protein